jgi:hypothetical protein
MKRKGLFCIGATVACLAALNGCARGGHPAINLTSLQPGREAGVVEMGEWIPFEAGIAFFPPEGLDPADPAAVRESGGVSVGLVPDFRAQDVMVIADLSYTDKGAPSVLLRVQEEKGVITAMYAVALFDGGIILWRYKDEKWTRLFTRLFETPENRHVLKVEARGATIAGTLDGMPIFQGHDTMLVAPGRVGVRAAEGPCAVHDLIVSEL